MIPPPCRFNFSDFKENIKQPHIEYYIQLNAIGK